MAEEPAKMIDVGGGRMIPHITVRPLRAFQPGDDLNLRGQGGAAPADAIPRFPATDAEMAYEGAHPDDYAPELQRRRQEEDELDALYEMMGQAGKSPQEVLIKMHEAGALGGNRTAMNAAERLGRKPASRRTRTVAPRDEPQSSSSEPIPWGAIATDVARGTMEAPRQIIGGIRDAAQAAINGVDAVADWIESKVKLGGFGFESDPDNPELPDRLVSIPAGDPRLAPDKTGFGTLPTVKKAESTTGGVVRSVSQFLTGFVGAGKLLGSAGKAETVGGQIAVSGAKGAIADATVFEGHEKRLSDLIQQVPALKNPVNEFLSSNKDDSELESRLKRGIEGLALGVLTEGLILSLKAIRAGRQATAAEEAEAGARAAAAGVAAGPRPAAPMSLLGDAAQTSPLVARAAQKGEKATAATGDLGVPDDVAARALTEKGFSALDAKRDVFINWARIRTDTDVKQVMQDVADAFKGDVDAMRRGVRTNVKTVEAAAKEDAWDILLTRRRGESLNAEQSVASRQLWEASGRKLLEVAELASTSPTPENLFQFRKMLSTHYAIQGEVIAARTETARALQSWAIPVGGDREMMRSIEDMVNKAGGADLNAAFAARIAALRNVSNGMAALDEVVSKTVMARSLDAIKEAWVMALLSGPKTHIVNTVSNASVVVQTIVERAGAARFSQAFGSGDIPIGEAAAQYVGMMGAIRDAFRYAGKTFQTGESGFGLGKVELPFDRAISSHRLGIREDNWLAGSVDALGTIINLPGRALLTEDEFFKTIGYRMEIHAQAFRVASREVADGQIPKSAMKARQADIIANPPENIRLEAADAAMYQTFTTAPGTWVKAINRVEQELSQSGSPAGELGSAAMRFVLPFRNTPSNILKYTFERTPLAPLMQRYRDAIAIGGADADIARTRMALGTMTILLATDLAMDGHLTGSGPDKNERGERGAMQRSGWQPYSVKVGDRHYAYNRMDPIGFTFGIGADLAEMIQSKDISESDRVEIQKIAVAAAASVGNNILSKSYMRGLGEAIGAILEPERQASRYVDRMAGSFMPTGVADIAKAVDPYMRETHDMLTVLKSRTPGMSSTLPIRRDLWGRPRMFESGLGATYDAMSPIYSKREEVQPIDREMMEQGWYLGMPAKPAGANRPEVFSRFLELQGQTKPSELGSPKLLEKYGDQNLLDTLNGIVTGVHPLGEQYRKLEDDDERAKLVRRVATDFRRAAKAKVMKEFKLSGEEE